MTGTLAHGHSSESTQQELSNKYQHESSDFFKKPMHSCALDESGFSIERVKSSSQNVVWMYNTLENNLGFEKNI